VNSLAGIKVTKKFAKNAAFNKKEQKIIDTQMREVMAKAVFFE